MSEGLIYKGKQAYSRQKDVLKLFWATGVGTEIA